MPKSERNSRVTKKQLDEMRKWREEFGQSVRQVTVRNKSTKDNPGTLPINCYIAKPNDPKPVDFSNLSLTVPLEEEYPRPATALFKKGAFLVIKPGYQPTSLPEAPIYLGRCNYAVNSSVRKLTATIFIQDILVPYNFINAELQCQNEVTGILREVTNILIEDDFVAVDEDEYYSAVIDCMDHRDQMTPQECQETAERSEQELTDMLENNERSHWQEQTTVATISRRSGRRIRLPDWSSFVFYD